MDRFLRWFAMIWGGALVAICLLHAFGGASTNFGMGEFTASADNQVRYFAVVGLVYAVAYIWLGREQVTPRVPALFLGAVTLASGLIRVLSILVYGLPHPFWLVMMPLEWVAGLLTLLMAYRAARPA